MTHESDQSSVSSRTHAKKIIVATLLPFLCMIVAFLFIRESRDSCETSGHAAAQAASTSAQGPAATANAKASVQPSHKIIAYYFHGTFRCPTCHKIELYTQEAIETSFADALKDGRLEWRVLNVDEPEHKHFVNDYSLYTKSVVLSDIREGTQVKWKNLDKVWRLIGNKEGFLDYIRAEVASYLEGK